VGIKYIAEALAVNKSLKAINIGGLISPFCLVLRLWPYFFCLDNNLGEEGMAHLAESLKVNNSIKDLGLDRTEFILIQSP